MQPIRIKVCQESDLRMLGNLARNIQRVLPVTQADIDAAAALGKGWVVKRVYEVSDPLDNLRGGTQLVIKQNSILPGQNVQRVLIVANPEQQTVIVGPGIAPLLLPDAVANELLYVKAYGGLTQNGLPTDITPIEYIENAANTLVKTGIVISNNDNFKIDITATAVSGSFYLFQARDKVNQSLGNNNITGLSGAQSGATILGSPGIENVTVQSGVTRGSRIGHKLNFVYECADGNMSLYVKDIDSNVSSTDTGTYDPTLLNRATTGMCLFGNEAPAGTGAGQVVNRLVAGCRVYRAKLWVNGKLVLDYIPAMRTNASPIWGFWDTVSQRFITASEGSLDGSLEDTSFRPTPSDPVDLACNNGALKVLDKSQWTIFTNPTSIAGQGVYVSANGKWTTADDRGAGVAIPLTIGKQYTLTIHQKTVALGTTLRFGQSPQATPTSAGVQLTDWYRGTIADGQIISFVAKLPYLVIQFSAVAVESGMIQEAVEVLEAQGADYTFVDSIAASGTQYIDTGILAGSDIKAEVKFKPANTSSAYCALGGRDAASGTSRNAFGIWANVSGRTRFDFQSNSVSSTLGSSTTNWNIAVKDGVENYFNGTQEESNDEETFASVRNMYLFAMLSGTTGATGQMDGSIAYCKIWKAGVLVRDFMPAIRNSDNVVGMYDTVSGTFFENQGTGVFVAGTVIGSGEVLKLTPSNDTAGVANLLKINTYVDTQEILTGVINHKLGIYVFDGTENWVLSNSSLGQFYLADASIDYSTASTCMCSHFVGISNGESLNNYPDENVIRAGYSGGNPTWAQRFIVQKVGTSQLSTFKSFLATQYTAGTPVIIVYPLATAQDEINPIPQTMQVVDGNNTLDIVQAGMGGLEIETQYTKVG